MKYLYTYINIKNEINDCGSSHSIIIYYTFVLNLTVYENNVGRELQHNNTRHMFRLQLS